MALKTDVLLRNDALLPQQYVRIDAIEALKDRLLLIVGIYYSQETASSPPHHALEYDTPYNLEGENPWVQGYEFLKNTEFSESENV